MLPTPNPLGLGGSPAPKMLVPLGQQQGPPQRGAPPTTPVAPPLAAGAFCVFRFADDTHTDP